MKSIKKHEQKYIHINRNIPKYILMYAIEAYMLLSFIYGLNQDFYNKTEHWWTLGIILTSVTLTVIFVFLPPFILERWE